MDQAIRFGERHYGANWKKVKGWVRAWHAAKVKDHWQDRERNPIAHWEKNLIRYVDAAWRKERDRKPK